MLYEVITFAEQRDGKLRRSSLEVVSEAKRLAGSFIEVLARVGISEHATRSTLSRMTRRGLLERKRQGRKIYFRMTERCVAIV